MQISAIWGTRLGIILKEVLIGTAHIVNGMLLLSLALHPLRIVIIAT